MSVILETTLGDIVIDLFTEERPRACLNFLKLCKIKYYNYCLFHSVEQNFMAQTGDPSGSGRGGESVFSFLYGEQAKYFDMETKPILKHKALGTVSMVNGGNNMLGSQFFITLEDNLDYLDGVHTVFGEVVEGQDVLEKINDTICDDHHRPYQDIRISHTVIVDDPFDDPPGLPVPDRSPEPTQEQLESGRIGADEEIDDTKGKTTEQIDEMLAERELKAGTQILEMVGDLPDADVKPPENVLFVCKLNPVTKDEDLEIIFARFGPIKSCEVIRDQKSGESLQYAFIEFEKEEDCEKAYFKMDNVLIDDRRIHVDFSQSVSKVQLQKQGARPVIDKKDNQAPRFTVKDRRKTGRSGYDLVFDDDGESEGDNDEGHRKNAKKRNKRESTADSDTERERKKKKRGHEDERDGRRRERGRREKSHSDDEKSPSRERRRPEEGRKGDEKRHKKHRERSSDEGEDRGRRRGGEDEQSRSRERRRSAERERDKTRRKSRDHSNDDEEQRRKRHTSEYKERHKDSSREREDSKRASSSHTRDRTSREHRKETSPSYRRRRAGDKASDEHRHDRRRNDR